MKRLVLALLFAAMLLSVASCQKSDSKTGSRKGSNGPKDDKTIAGNGEGKSGLGSGGNVSLDGGPNNNASESPQLKSATIEGTLTEARGYFTTGAIGGDYLFASFMSLKANLPVGILKDDSQFVYLVVRPSDFADHAAETVKAEGNLLPGGHVMLPEKFWVKNETGWQEVELSR